jgi:hypothetical protein
MGLGFELSVLHVQSKHSGTLLIEPYLWPIFALVLDMGSHQLFAQAGLQSASQVTRIIGMSHWHLVAIFFVIVICLFVSDICSGV